MNKSYIITAFLLFWIFFYTPPHLVSAQEIEEFPLTTSNYKSSSNNKYNATNDISSSLHSKRRLWRNKNDQKQHYYKGKLTDKNAIRNFLLYNYAHVADDIINGSGIYLDTLFTLLGIPEKNKKLYRRYFLTILLEQKRVPDFSNCISNLDSDR